MWLGSSGGADLREWVGGWLLRKMIELEQRRGRRGWSWERLEDRGVLMESYWWPCWSDTTQEWRLDEV